MGFVEKVCWPTVKFLNFNIKSVAGGCPKGKAEQDTGIWENKLKVSLTGMQGLSNNPHQDFNQVSPNHARVSTKPFSCKALNRDQISPRTNEKKFKTLEKERPDALEVAA